MGFWGKMSELKQAGALGKPAGGADRMARGQQLASKLSQSKSGRMRKLGGKLSSKLGSMGGGGRY